MTTVGYIVAAAAFVIALVIGGGILAIVLIRKGSDE